MCESDGPPRPWQSRLTAHPLDVLDRPTGVTAAPLTIKRFVAASESVLLNGMPTVIALHVVVAHAATVALVGRLKNPKAGSSLERVTVAVRVTVSNRLGMMLRGSVPHTLYSPASVVTSSSIL